MSKIILLGRGESVNRCTKKFVDSHDIVVIINNIIYKGYEHLVSDHADIIFGNRTSLRYTHNEAKELGLKEAIFTGKSDQSFDRKLENVTTEYPNLRDEFMEIHGFDPSSGVQALFYFLKYKKPTEISLVGFDYYEVGLKPYYFKPHEAPREQKALWGSEYKGDVINVPSGHDTDLSIEYFKNVVLEHKDITFNSISNSQRINNIKANNFNNINLNE
jgi:hypothetical protein